MAFKDVLRFLYQKAKRDGLVKNQDEFGARHGYSREHINQFMSGAEAPIKAIGAILEKEGLNPIDCIQVPNIRDQYKELFDDLETIVASGDPDRIQGIATNLYDLAAGAKSGRRPPKVNLGDEKHENIESKEERSRGSPSKPRRASSR